MSTLIYTDGGMAKRNPGFGGWAAVIATPTRVVEIGGHVPEITTNNRMELMGPIKALSFLRKPTTLTLYCDSQYVVFGVTKWMRGWRKRGWTNSSGDPVSNRDLWERLLAAMLPHTITWTHIRGHQNILGNERCDHIASAFATNQNPVVLYDCPRSEYYNLAPVPSSSKITEYRTPPTEYQYSLTERTHGR